MSQEEKRDRFQRLAPKRTNTVLQKLKILGNCANRYTYDYTEEEVSRIFSEVEQCLRETKSKFRPAKEKKAFTW